jgi:nicotinate-nucleotide adenylyltransferase
MSLDPRALSAARLGVFGGTFDPVHNGHLHVALTALRALDLDHIVFIPARQSPHKESGAQATGAERLEMLRLAIESDERLAKMASIWDFELQAEGPSYTVRTLEELSDLRSCGGVEGSMFFLMGSDQFDGLPRWKDVERVFRLCHPCVVLRSGNGTPELENLRGVISDGLLHKLAESFLTPDPVDLAATELRQQIGSAALGSAWIGQPESVAVFIQTNGLYRV